VYSCFALLLVTAFAVVLPGYAQSSSPIIRLHGTVHPEAQAKYDRGAVDDSLPMPRLLLSMARSPERETALRQFLHNAHTAGSPQYHHWLTPEEYGQRFGATDDDLQVVSGWLQAQGFTVNRVTRSRGMVEFSGTAGNVRAALHTEIHKYVAPHKTFHANASEIAVPEAIASRVSSFAPLNDLPLTSYVKPIVTATYSRATHRAVPDDTTTESGNPYFYALGPEDYATQYDIAPVYKAGTDGTGVTIGIVGTSNINLALVDAYRTLFGLPASHAQVIVDGSDPGDTLTPNVEAYLDVEASGAVAPGATVNFYVAGGQPFQDALSLAALRAVEDNQASVISVSYGECEQSLGEAGNHFWAGLWEQAAAQGQTVMVSSGDSGPTTCPFVNGLQSNSTLSVSGLSSTPWNVSVGGTDFYYSDYASGAPSAATFWNQTNDMSLGSLKESLHEQPWSDALGLNAIPANFSGAFVIPSDAGGGGVSTCSQTTVPAAGTLPTCITGYAKPDWQNAPGVPKDGARDLPDVSLFAATGANLSAWAICAYPWECAAASGAQTPVLLVGGTSAAAPAMAGIMALVNQKYGRQGQANYTLYQLARQIPSVFHDLTVGNNDVLCTNLFPSNPVSNASGICSTPVPGIGLGEIASYGIYSAGAGYDLASGLGSLDVNQLIQNWNKAAFTASATTLQLSPLNVVHGAAVAVVTSVTAGSGSGTPTGDVVLVTSSPTPIPENNALTLANGKASANFSNLPGGTYTVTAQYGGDATFAASASTPVSVTVTPEASTTALNGVYATTSSGNPAILQRVTIAGGASVPFGSAWYFEAAPSGQTSNSSGLATGTATFTDGSITAIVPLNINGVATWSPQSLALGAHSVSVKYSGDASYNGSSAGPLAFTVVKGTPALTVSPEGFQRVGSGDPPTIGFAAGSILVVHVVFRNQGSVVPPTGNVTVKLGSMSQTSAVTANSYLNEGLSTVFATFNNVPAGTYTLSASYAGDSNWNAATYTDSAPVNFVAVPASATTTTLKLTPANVDSSGSVTFTVTVQASAPVMGLQSSNTYGVVNLYANGTAFAGISLPVPTVAGATTFTATQQIAASELPLGALQVTAAYEGFVSFAPSVSAAVPLTVTATDFQLSAVGSNLAVKAGGSLSVPVNLGGSYGNTVAVALTCAGSSSSIGCAISPGSVSVSGSGTATLTVNAFIPGTSSSSSSSSVRVPGGPANRWLPVGGTIAFSLAFGWLVPRRRRRILLPLMLCAVVSGGLFVGCGGSSAHSTPPPVTPTPSANVNAPAGNYSVVVTGVSGGITHNTKVSFVVQ
jgi:Pro-kumamolisin, activation domain/Bacterial Ig-like domain (group 3)